MFTDPIADMLTRIRNGLAARKEEVRAPFSNIKFAIAKILESEKYIQTVEKTKNQHEEILIKLRYEDGGPAIRNIKRVSKPGCRVYARNKEMPRVLSGHGIFIVSTPEGIMTDREAKKKHLGGEIICEVF
jgi:small subunit ribosomal protein S8